MCQMSEETSTHALFQCEHARAAWFDSFMGILSNSIQEVCPMGWWKRINKMSGSSPHSSSCQIQAWVVALWWAIWRYRNDSIFRGMDCHPLKILSFASKVVDSYNLTSNASGTQSLKFHTSLPKGASDNIARVLCDATFRASYGKAGYGFKLFGLVTISFLQVQWVAQRFPPLKKLRQELFSQPCILPKARDSR